MGVANESEPRSQQSIKELRLSTKAYSMEAIQAATYDLSNRFNIVIRCKDEDAIITIESRAPVDADARAENEFLGSVIDHQVRINLSNRFGGIRDIIVAHAFGHIDIEKQLQEKNA